jgi:DNA mismatch repair protein MutS2
MRKELVDFVLKNELSPFSLSKTLIKKGGSIYRTKDARSIHSKVLARLSSGFVFGESSNLWSCFGLDGDLDEVKRRQEFFSGLKSEGGDFLKELNKPRASWKPRYDVVIVTEDEGTFVSLNELGCGVVLLTNQNDVAELERYDVVQVVDCGDFKSVLERLPQSVFLESADDAYLERFLEELSGWRENFAILNGAEVSFGVRECLDLLTESFALLENKEGKIISESEVERVLEEVNEEVGEKIKEMTISGEGLMKMLGEGKMPSGILEIVRGAIERSGISEHVFNLGVPVTIDYKELEHQIKVQSANEFTDVAERIKRSASKLKGIPGILKRLEAEIVVEDFCNGVCEYMSESMRVPIFGNDLFLGDCLNMFLKDAKPISFILNDETRCSILTGANSGGKTTLLEHVLQNISLFRMGLPVMGEFRSLMFEEVYYFAKTKGSTSKGAFEMLLTQMAGIKFGRNTLILADEIEAVTEPGVAGRIIGATAEYFVGKGCFVILATHLGAEIAKALPEGARVDGIEASGLDEDFNLIVNHNPVLGRLASSTPELIVERMAGSIGGEYFEHLLGKIKKKDL